MKVKLAASSADGEEGDVTVRVIDWTDAANNDFFVAQQFWVQGEIYLRRADLVAFVNGLPLVFIELKGIHRNVETAYRENFRDSPDGDPASLLVQRALDRVERLREPRRQHHRHLGALRSR